MQTLSLLQKKADRRRASHCKTNNEKPTQAALADWAKTELRLDSLPSHSMLSRLLMNFDKLSKIP